VTDVVFWIDAGAALPAVGHQWAAGSAVIEAGDVGALRLSAGIRLQVGTSLQR